MPRVPTYDNFNVLPAALPQARVQAQDIPDIAGRQLQNAGRAMGQAGAELSRIALDVAQQANQARVNDAMNKAVQAKLKLTYDPGEGFVHLRGDAALTRPNGKALDAEYDERYGKALDEIEAGLGNDLQRQTFREQAGRLRQQFNGSITQHVAKEFSSYQDSVHAGTIDTARQQMALAWGDAEAVMQSRDAIKAAVVEQGRLRGLSGQQVQANMVEALSPGHAAVIASAVEGGKLDYAREYMKQVGAELTPQARLQITKVLDAGDFEARTQDGADALWAKHNGDVMAALREAREKYSGKEEDAIVTRIKGYDSEKTVLRERAQKDAADEAWRVYAQTRRLPSPALQALMDGKDLEALRRTARVDAEARSARSEAKTDPSVYYALTVAAASDPNFKKEDLRAYFDKLSPGDRKHFIDLQAKTLKPNEADDVVTASQQITTLTKQLKLKDRDAGTFADQANRALFAAQQEKGNKLNQAERQKVLDRLIVEGTTSGGSWFSSNKARLFEAQAAGRGFTPKFNDEQRRKAAQALQREGIQQPTAQQVEAVLRKHYGFQ